MICLNYRALGGWPNLIKILTREKLVREVVELLYGRLHEKKVVVEVGKDLPMIFGDRQRLFEVFQNLIDNAAKFMGRQPNPRIEIGHNGFENGCRVFYVRDNGMGIEPMHHDRIFGLFNKLDARVKAPA